MSQNLHSEKKFNRPGNPSKQEAKSFQLDEEKLGRVTAESWGRIKTVQFSIGSAMDLYHCLTGANCYYLGKSRAENMVRKKSRKHTRRKDTLRGM